MNTSMINLEILRMARKIVIDQYTDTRAEAHNKWLVESDHLWRNQRLRLAYPTIPPHPTEQDIVARAQLMIDFVHKQSQASSAHPIEPADAIVEPVTEPEPIPVSPTVEELPLPQVEQPPQVPAPPLQEEPPAIVTEDPAADTKAPQVVLLPVLNTTPPVRYAITDGDVEALTDYAKMKSSTNQEEHSSLSGRVLPNVLKRLDDLRSSWR